MAIEMIDLAAGDAAIRLSPYCWRTKFALVHKGLPFDAKAWRFTDKAMLAPTGSARVPVIRDMDRDPSRWIADSWQIALYLDQTYPESPLMVGEPGRAMARLVASWCDTVLHPAIARFATLDIYDSIADIDRAYFRQSREQRFGVTLETFCADRRGARMAVHKLLLPFEQMLAEHPFAGGSAPSYADYALAGSLMWPHTIAKEPLLDDATAVGQWFQRMLDLHDGYGRKAPTVRDEKA